MVIKMVEINSDHGCDHVAFVSKSLPVTSKTETRSLGTGSREQPEAGALYSTWHKAEVIFTEIGGVDQSWMKFQLRAKSLASLPAVEALRLGSPDGCPSTSP